MSMQITLAITTGKQQFEGENPGFLSTAPPNSLSITKSILIQSSVVEKKVMVGEEIEAGRKCDKKMKDIMISNKHM